jgi:hypothetical protein
MLMKTSAEPPVRIAAMTIPIAPTMPKQCRQIHAGSQ